MTRVGLRCLASAFCAALLLSGCSTPQTVRDQATLTASHITLINRELKRFAAQSEQAARQRIDRVEDLHRVTDEVANRRAEVVAAMQKADQSGPLKIHKDIVDVSEQAEKREIDRAGREAKLHEKLEAGVRKIDIPAEKLAQSADMLARLGQPSTQKQDFAFFQAFVSDVLEEYRKHVKASKEALQKANRDSDTASGTTKTATTKSVDAAIPSAVSSGTQ